MATWGVHDQHVVEGVLMYMTNMAVIETGMLVLKCSLLKNKVACNYYSEKESCLHGIYHLSNHHDEQGWKVNAK